VAHLVLVYVAFVARSGRPAVISTRIRPGPGRGSLGTVLFALSMLGAVALVLTFGATHAKDAPDGLFERALLALELLWIATAAYLITTKSGPQGN
jgi:hypothetical protein